MASLALLCLSVCVYLCVFVCRAGFGDGNDYATEVSFNRTFSVSLFQWRSVLLFFNVNDFIIKIFTIVSDHYFYVC